MFYEQNIVTFGNNNFDVEYLPNIFSGKIIDKELLI